MPKLLTTLLLAGGIVTAAATVQADDIRTERVHFPKGEIDTSIRDTIKGRETVDYKLRAHAGQGNGSATIKVSWPDGGERYVYFENGKATSSDSGAVSTERQGAT